MNGIMPTLCTGVQETKHLSNRPDRDIMWTMATAMQTKADFTSHRIIFEAKSQVIIDRNCEFFLGKTNDSVCSPEVEARCTREDHFTA